MNDIERKIEGLLFIAGKPLTGKKIAEIIGEKPEKVADALKSISAAYKEEERGMHIMQVNSTYQMATKPEHAPLVESFIKSEQSGELSKPSLETLTIIAYRGPVAKSELEQIRGVNCSLILRNLLIKGLIEAAFDRTLKATVYTITMPFLEFLGISSPQELPDYDRLHSDERLQELLRQQLERATHDEEDANGAA